MDVERKDGTPLAGRAGASATPTSSTSPTSSPRYDELVVGRARQHAAARRLPGREHHAHQPGRHRHGRLGAAADARPGHDHRHRRDRLPARPRRRPTRRGSRELGVQKVMTMTSHLRPPRDPGRGVGRVPAPDRPAAPGRRRLLRRACSEPRPGGAGGGAERDRRRAGPAAATPAAAGGRPGRATTRCSRRCRRPPRWSRRTACTATWPRTSTRSAPSRSATRRSSPRPSASRPR